MKRSIAVFLLSLLVLGQQAQASTAYGTLNNFDVVNDTGEPCHGFEIEIEDIHCKDITYTYDWNHYGTPRIWEDNSDPLHSRVYIRYESKQNPDGTWSAYTAVPTGPIAPTDGHQFVNPSVNFGGEHFGVGFYGVPGAVRYFWLVDNGAGSLVRGPMVNIATPSFVYYPPANLVPAQVVAVIEPPEPPELPVLEFGEASWVKETRTQTHNNNPVELADLVSDDPDDPNDPNWKNNEPDEVEVEWAIFQTDFNKADGGANGALVGGAEDLPDGDEIITRRYDFFKYVGPIDAETGEALADKVGPDGIHGEGLRLIDGVEVDLSTYVVVGDYIGAQMAGYDQEADLGLIDHLQDAELDAAYPDRAMVIGGTPPIATTTSGALPAGMSFDAAEGVLSGTPTEAGQFLFTVHSTDANAGDVTRTYALNVVDPNAAIPVYNVSTGASPVFGGTTSGDGDFYDGTNVTVTAVAEPGYEFVNWTEGGVPVSAVASYEFAVASDRVLVANFSAVANVPTVVSSVRSDANPTKATTVKFLVTFSESVTGVDVTDFTLSTVGIPNAYVSGVPGTGTTRSVSVQTGTGNGTICLEVHDDDTIVNGSAVPLGGVGLVNGEFLAGEFYTVDKVKPTVALSTSAGKATKYSPIPVTATFSEAVAGFTGTDITATNATVSDFAGDGAVYTFNLIPTVEGSVTAKVSGGKCSDPAGNVNAASTVLSVRYDTVAPSAVSIVRQNTNPTRLGTVKFKVTFSESVVGVNLSDFALTTSGSVTGAYVSGITGSGAAYAVSVKTGTNDGTIRLDLLNDGTIGDAAGNLLTAAFSGGQTYTIDKTRPSVVLASAEPNPTGTAPFLVTITFSEPVTGLLSSEIAVTNATVSSFSGSGANYTFLLDPIAAGSATAKIGGGVARDAAGNTSTASNTLSRTIQ